MSKLKKKKTSFLNKLRNYFFTGVVVLIPIGITLYLTKFIIQISSNLIPKEINPNHYLPFSIPGIEILLSIFLITLIGGLSLSFLGKKILQLIDDLFKRIFNMDRRKFIQYVGCGCCGFVLNSCSNVPITDRKQLRIIPESKLNSQAAQIY